MKKLIAVVISLGLLAACLPLPEGASGFNLFSDLYPSLDNFYNVGENTTPLRWKAMHAINGYFGAVTTPQINVGSGAYTIRNDARS